MDAPLGVGLIGFGYIGKVHAYGYRTMPLFYDPLPVPTRLVGVATSRPETARRAAEQGGFAFGTADWRDLLDRDDIHIIDIASPNHLHLEQLLAAIAANKHIYCDKPLVVTAEEAARVEEALAGYRGIGQMTLQYRFYPATLRAKQLVDEGLLGNLIGLRGAYLHAGSVDPERPMGWKQLASAGGGVLRDLGSHILDLVDHLVGPFDRVLAETRVLYPTRPLPGAEGEPGERVDVEAEDQVLMWLQAPNGALGTLEASKIATGAEDELRFELHGDRGALRFNLMEPNHLEAYDLRDPDAPLGGHRGWKRIDTVQHYGGASILPSGKAAVGWMRGHLHCLYHFLQGVAAGEQPEPSLQAGVRLQRMLDAAERAAQSGAWQDLA
ncbi:MAG: Gfo/Idh/MocA family oxidoreductase [Chloroflexi bacterium]|nr:Gfo/Idh/MocA family oxidoreductase [Chloroflexota bacterium]